MQNLPATSDADRVCMLLAQLMPRTEPDGKVTASSLQGERGTLYDIVS
jgi:hypothetical protein